MRARKHQQTLPGYAHCSGYRGGADTSDRFNDSVGTSGGHDGFLHRHKLLVFSDTNCY